VQEWRDILTHPEVYRTLFSEWVGHTYVYRAPTEPYSEEAEANSRAGRPAPSWLQADENRGLGIGTTDLYAHVAPERFGHETHLVPVEDSPLALAFQADFKQAMRATATTSDDPQTPPYSPVWVDIMQDDDDDDDILTAVTPDTRSAPQHLQPIDPVIPTAVVRLRDLGWYFAGFLASILVWTHMVLNEAVAVASVRDNGGEGSSDSSDQIRVFSGFSLKNLLAQPEKFLDASLYTAWTSLIHSLGQASTKLRHPIPDLIRAPQEWCYQISRGKGNAIDHVLWQGWSGPDRRTFLQQRWPRDVGQPEWLLAARRRPSDATSAKVVRSLQQSIVRGIDAQLRSSSSSTQTVDAQDLTTQWQVVTRYLRFLQDDHNSFLYRARMMGLVDPRRIALAERYLPLPEPPHPMPALFLPWSYQIDRRETVCSMAVVRDMVLDSVAIPCLETGLALEEWGRAWSVDQRVEQRAWYNLEDRQKHQRLKDAVLSGQSVPHWEEPFLRRLLTRDLVVLDESGPIGDGYLCYDDDAAAATATTTRERDVWFRLDRMHTVERIGLRGPAPDEAGRWEDSGIEMPAVIHRDPVYHRLLRSLTVKHVSSALDHRSVRDFLAKSGLDANPPLTRIYLAQWREAAAQVGRRVWTPLRITPWPVLTTVANIDLTRLDPLSLSLAPVIRELHLNRVALRDPSWLRDLLTMPSRVSTQANRDLDVGARAWLDLIQDSGLQAALHPMARRTLVWLALDSIAYTHHIRQNIRSYSGLLFPGKPHPFRDQTARALPSPFRHYPNLNYVSLHDNDLTDIPAGLLDWMLSTQARQPPQGTGQSDPSSLHRRRTGAPIQRMVMWDLSSNRIANLGQQSLEALAWIVVQMYAPESRFYGAFTRTSDTQRPIPRLLINLWGNPVLRQPGFHYKQLTARDPDTGEETVTGSALRSTAYLQQQLQFLGPGGSRDLRKQIRQFQVPNVDRLAAVMSSMLVAVHPDVFQHNMHSRRDQADQLQHRWLI
jgi:hypothetical protein